MKDGWHTKRLGELAEVIAGQSPDGSCYNTDAQGMAFYQGKKEFGDKFIGEPTTWTTQVTRIALEGDVLMSVRAPVGPVNFATREICIGRGLAAIRSRNQLDRNFLFYFLLKNRNEIEGTEGAVFASINKGQIEQIEIAAPPLPEQQRIVGILDEGFEGIATVKSNAEKNLQNARALFESHLQFVFTRGGNGWVESTIGETCTLKSGTTVSPTLERPVGNIPYLKVADMTFDGNEDSITTSSRFLSEADVKESAIIPEGATIFPKRGGAILTNKKRMTLVPICADLNIMAVIPTAQIEARLLYFYFLNVDMRKLGTGSSIPQINNYDIAPLLIAFPESVVEQRKIISELEELRKETQRLASLYQRKLAAMEELKKSLLHQAFTGQL